VKLKYEGAINMKKMVALGITIFFFFFSLKACNDGIMVFNLKDITMVEITNGSDGTTVNITDADYLVRLVQSFNGNEFLRGDSAKNYTGWSYRFRFISDDKSQAEIFVNTDNVIIYNNRFYHNGSGAIDFRFYNELLSETDDIVNYKILLALLEANGFSYEEVGTSSIAESFLSVSSKPVYIGDDLLVIYEYDSNEAMESDSSYIDKSGFSIMLPDKGVEISWVSDPYWFYKDFIIVNYVGENVQIINFLHETLSFFAGHGYS
jgi:hypothetical protein